WTAYLFLPDEKAGVRLEGLEMPGKPLERDERAELNPAPRDPAAKIPVTLLTDDADPRAEKGWQEQLGKRFAQAAEVLEKSTGIRVEVAGFDNWKSAADAKTTADLLAGLEGAVKAKEGTLVVGYSSRRIDEKVDPAFGACRGLGGRHILIREWTPKNESERVEVLVGYLARALGGVTSPDPGSALRAKLGDGYTLHPGAVVRLDPLNALALNLWADERRRQPGVSWDTLTAVYRARLTRVYLALEAAARDEKGAKDPIALAYLKELGAEAVKSPDPKEMRHAANAKALTDAVQRNLKALTQFAQKNAAAGDRALKGDALTAAYIQTVAQSAVTKEGPEMVPGFLLTLGLGLDDAGTLLDDPITAGAVKEFESPDERRDRLKHLGNPTIDGRRDLRRRFALGCAVGALLPPESAESAAVGRAQFDLHTLAGLGFQPLAAELAGIACAQTAHERADLL
ncbi:MAG: hypothetical protein K2V38_29245, partial [Gemmataceae bacterium]|nr:hypothetical protein [Gemmataceae bacterium]